MNCLLCYKPLVNSEIDYHQKCVVKVFGLKLLPLIDIDTKNLTSHAKKIVGANTAITGVQPKLSLWLGESMKNIRFTVVDGKSNYIIKPQSETYPSLPENEDLCMHLASHFGINTAIHGLVRLPDATLAYITKRFERRGEAKIACEDLCQLSELLTEHKYRGSYEKTGKIIRQYSTQAGLDALHYFELVVFGFVTGNADMHLKNFSMFEIDEGQFTLSPAYDLVSTFLVIKNEPEQMSLTINGRKNKLVKSDFDALATSLLLTEKQRQNVYLSFAKRIETAIVLVKMSFLSDTHKELFIQILRNRVQLLNE